MALKVNKKDKPAKVKPPKQLGGVNKKQNKRIGKVEEEGVKPPPSSETVRRSRERSSLTEQFKKVPIDELYPEDKQKESTKEQDKVHNEVVKDKLKKDKPLSGTKRKNTSVDSDKSKQRKGLKNKETKMQASKPRQSPMPVKVSKNENGFMSKIKKMFGTKTEKVNEEIVSRMTVNDIVGESSYAYTKDFREYTDYPKGNIYVDIDNPTTPEQFIKDYSERNEIKVTEKVVPEKLDFGVPVNPIEETLDFGNIEDSLQDEPSPEVDEIKLEEEIEQEISLYDSSEEIKLEDEPNEENEEFTLEEKGEDLNLSEEHGNTDNSNNEDDDLLLIGEDVFDSIGDIPVDEALSLLTDEEQLNEEELLLEETNTPNIELKEEEEHFQLTEEENVQLEEEEPFQLDEESDNFILDEEQEPLTEQESFLLDNDNTIENVQIPSDILHQLKDEVETVEKEVSESVAEDIPDEPKLVFGKQTTEEKQVDVNPKSIGLTFNVEDMRPERRESSVNKTFLESKGNDTSINDDIIKSINSDNKSELVKGSTSIAEALKHLR